jgi:hypothetical protein
VYGVGKIGLTVKKNIKFGYPVPKRPTVISALPVNWFKFKDIGRTAGQGNRHFGLKFFVW